MDSPVARLAERLRNATSTHEAADALSELTATHDGLLAALEEVLTATAELPDELSQATDPHTAQRLRHLADEHQHIIRTDLTYLRNTLANRHAPHPGRSTRTEEMPATEGDHFAVRTGPPLPRTLPATSPPDVAGLCR
ncbi:hypothetical protein [Streptomyces buecherae]|uniref:hypothetical protein n=1 Tax=Streptomyces buecherae TaxID=2763006 RepID=UPI00366713CF